MSNDVENVIEVDSLDNNRGVTQRVIKEETINNMRGVTRRVYVVGGGSTINNQDISVTLNGEYTADEGYTGLGTVTVNVPSTAPDYYIALADDGNGVLTKTAPVLSVPTGSEVNTLGTRALYYAYSNAAFPANTDVDLSGITSIDSYGLSYAFQNCTGLRNVNLGGLTSVTGTNPLNYAFSASSIKSLDMHSFNPTDSTQTVAYMCRNCTNLTTVDLSSATALYGTNPFQGCTSLTTVSFSNNFNVSTASMFSGITTLSTINGTITGVSSGNNAFSGCIGLTSLNFFKPTSITSAQNMFQGCTGITSVDMSTLTSLSGTGSCQYMFKGCTNLVSADLSSLTTIAGSSTSNACAAYMFQNCTSLATVDLSNLSSTNIYGCYYMFDGCSALRTVICDPAKLSNTSIYFMFYNSGIADVSQILSGITLINRQYQLNGAFQNCTNITTVDLSAVTQITGTQCISNAFSNCTGITSVDFSGLQKIGNSSNNTGNNVFFDCTGITSITFNSLSDIASGNALANWFDGCTSLTSISFPALKSTSFGSYTNQFHSLVRRVTGCTVHFPSNLQSVIGSWDDVTNGFGGTNTTVLFDLPATE